MSPILAQLIGKKITSVRPLNDCELHYEGDGATDGLLIEVAGGVAAVLVINRTLDCDEFPSDECWTEMTVRTADGDEVDLVDGETQATN